MPVIVGDASTSTSPSSSRRFREEFVVVSEDGNVVSLDWERGNLMWTCESWRKCCSRRRER